MLLDIPCYWHERFGKPDCGDWLNGGANLEPDHVCYDIARASVEMFASERIVITCPLDTWYCAEWPLPIGADSIAEWSGKHLDQTADRDWFIQPTIRDPYALLGLAIKRSSDKGILWLLGLVNEDSPFDIIDPNGVLWDPDTISEQRREILDQVSQVRQQQRDVPASISRSYSFSEPSILIDGSPNPELLSQALVLGNWYQRILLGKTIVGRPRGTGTFRNKDDFTREISMAVQELKRQGKSSTQENVAEYLANCNRIASADVRQLRRWLHGFGFTNWSDLLSHIT